MVTSVSRVPVFCTWTPVDAPLLAMTSGAESIVAGASWPKARYPSNWLASSCMTAVATRSSEVTLAEKTSSSRVIAPDLVVSRSTLRSRCRTRTPILAGIT
jgi:hypothetical protein